MTDWHLTPEGREALSLAHSASVVCVLRLANGKFAIYNDIKHLQGIVDSLDEWPPPCWSQRRRQEQAPVDLTDLGIL